MSDGHRSGRSTGRVWCKSIIIIIIIILLFIILTGVCRLHYERGADDGFRR